MTKVSLDVNFKGMESSSLSVHSISTCDLNAVGLLSDAYEQTKFPLNDCLDG